jgi:shikimate dehydrogenase
VGVLRSSPHWPSASSGVVATIGFPVSHSVSPLLHQAAFDALGLDWVSVAFAVAPGDAQTALAGARALGIVGLSVTMPHKADTAANVDELTPLARRLGAVNCVTNREGRLLGDSTDGAGMLESLRRGAGFDPAGRRCAVIGAGGAARAAVAALGDAGASEVVVINRTADRARSAAALAGDAGRVGRPEDLGLVELVVHATSSGMAGGGGELTLGSQGPVDPFIRSGQVVMDLVYVPALTPLLQLARDRGAVTVGGIGMLVHQAAIAIEHWTGLGAPVEEMWKAALEAVGG